jgi:hypothetical protein
VRRKQTPVVGQKSGKSRVKRHDAHESARPSISSFAKSGIASAFSRRFPPFSLEWTAVHKFMQSASLLIRAGTKPVQNHHKPQASQLERMNSSQREKVVLDSLKMDDTAEESAVGKSALPPGYRSPKVAKAINVKRERGKQNGH